MSFINSKHRLAADHRFSGKVSWRSPSNIALIKYWGKRPVQLPANASISFTLSEAHTDTSVEYKPRSSQKEWVEFFFEGQKEQQFSDRVNKYFASLQDSLPFLDQLSFHIESSNSFPHSSGIASSASSMSALALCLCDIERLLFASAKAENGFYHKASYLSRLGSGSASRSVIPYVAVWGQSPHVPESSDEYAIPYESIQGVFKTFHDDVLIVSEEKKSVSSSQGHKLMDNNIFASSRYQQAKRNMGSLLEAMQSGDIMAFGKIVEDEALTLHALMMCSDPSFILMKPATLEVIEKIRAFRRHTGLPLFFTLDAGPNVHILYPDDIKSEVTTFINNTLLQFAQNGRIIRDHVGKGPVKLD